MTSSAGSSSYRRARRRMSGAQQSLQMSLEDVQHRLDHIDQDVKDVRDIVSTQGPWWKKWGIPAAILTLAGSLIGIFVSNYIGLENERGDLRSQVNTLQGQVSSLGVMRDLVSQYSALTTYAVQQNKLSQVEVSQFVKGTLRPTSAGLVRVAQITDPSERSQVPDGAIVRGVINSFKIGNARIVSDTCWTDGCSSSLSSRERTIWIVTQNTKTNRFYPQGRWSDHAGPVLINAAGEWVSPAVFTGGTLNGRPVLINAMLVDHRGEDVFKAYLKRGEVKDKNGNPKYGFPGLTRTELPAGADILATVMVFPK